MNEAAEIGIKKPSKCNSPKKIRFNPQI